MQRPNESTEPSSGPRCTSAAFIRSTRKASAGPAGATRPQIPHMRGTVRRGAARRRADLVECTPMAALYGVVSCHVEHPLDDRSWRLFADLQERRPSGFTIAALMRPPDASAGEDETLWLERARE